LADQLNTTFAALTDSTRRAILARLALGEASVTELAAPFEMSLPAVSKHLKVLERAHLIARGREAQWRPCRLQASPLKDAAGWLEHYRRFWTESFDRLDEYLSELQEEEKLAMKHKANEGNEANDKPGRSRGGTRPKRTPSSRRGKTI
jgi:DNA-binding transcriptional ArsR family regulator